MHLFNQIYNELIPFKKQAVGRTPFSDSIRVFCTCSSLPLVACGRTSNPVLLLPTSGRVPIKLDEIYLISYIFINLNIVRLAINFMIVI